MTRRLREHGLALVFAGVGVWTMVYLGLYGFAWTDYDFEVTPAYNALVAGHVWAFFQHAPGYGGSLELRAPFALLPGLWGGGEFAVYQVVALPCLIAAALLGVWLCSRMRALGSSTLARATALTLCVANPITMEACIVGHPEELFGAVLCIAAVLLAQRRVIDPRDQALRGRALGALAHVLGALDAKRLDRGVGHEQLGVMQRALGEAGGAAQADEAHRDLLSLPNFLDVPNRR